MTRLAAMLPDINYDLCVLTGDYRAETFGAYEPALAGIERFPKYSNDQSTEYSVTPTPFESSPDRKIWKCACC